MNITPKPLNAGQTAAAQELFKWLMRTDSKEIILSGPGGVGKSYLISYLIDTIIPQYQETCELLNLPMKFTEVHVTATSNKAAEVLSEATNRPCSTIHSFLGLIVVNNYSTGATSLKRNQKKWKIHENMIIIVDEYSMENHELYRHIHESTLNCKIIHVGDHCQLAAVGDTVPYVSKQGIERIDLTEPMRNKGQPFLQALCLQLRNTVETGEFLPIGLLPGVVDLLDDDQMQAEIESVFLDADAADTRRILAYSNGQVNAYNEFIREVRNLPPTPVKGEHLVCNSAFSPTKGTKGFSTEEEVFITDIDSRVETLQLPDQGELEYITGHLTGRFESLSYVRIPLDRNHMTQLIKWYAKKKDWQTYFDLKEKFPDLRPRDACTVHKSQGSSYDTVYIDLSDLSTCTNPSTAARLLYVAISRARNRVVFYGKLAARLGGLDVKS